jgi:hypothetical protein
MGADVLPYFVFTLGRDRLMAEQFTRSPCSVMLWSDLTLYLKPAPVLKLSIGWRRAVSSTLQPMDPGNTASGADWVGGWVGNQDASTRCGEGTPPPPTYQESNTLARSVAILSYQSSRVLDMNCWLVLSPWGNGTETTPCSPVITKLMLKT